MFFYMLSVWILLFHHIAVIKDEIKGLIFKAQVLQIY